MGGARADGGVAGRGGADRDLAAAQPAAYASVHREVALRRQDALSAGRRECEFDPSAAHNVGVNVADLGSPNGYGEAAMPFAPVVHEGTCLKVAGTVIPDDWEDSCAAGGLPSYFDQVRVNAPGDDVSAALLVALRLYRCSEGGGDDPSDGSQSCECGDGGVAGHRRLFRAGAGKLGRCLGWRNRGRGPAYRALGALRALNRGLPCQSLCWWWTGAHPRSAEGPDECRGLRFIRDRARPVCVHTFVTARQRESSYPRRARV